MFILGEYIELNIEACLKKYSGFKLAGSDTVAVWEAKHQSRMKRKNMGVHFDGAKPKSPAHKRVNRAARELRYKVIFWGSKSRGVV